MKQGLGVRSREFMNSSITYRLMRTVKSRTQWSAECLNVNGVVQSIKRRLLSYIIGHELHRKHVNVTVRTFAVAFFSIRVVYYSRRRK